MSRYNYTSQGLNKDKFDGYVVSYPKSGRTWVRTFIFKYFSILESRDLAFNASDFDKIPNLYFTHDIWENKIAWSVWDRIRGKGMVPKGEENTKPLILIARDPRDVVVSLFFHMQKRLKNKRALAMSLSQFISDKKFGLPMIIETMNQWCYEWSGANHFYLFRYEDMRKNPQKAFSKMLKCLHVPISSKPFEEALAFSDFRNVKKLESNGAFTISELSASDTNDSDSFKARRGVVGGYLDYFSEDDLEFSNNLMTKLDPVYKYLG